MRKLAAFFAASTWSAPWRKDYSPSTDGSRAPEDSHDGVVFRIIIRLTEPWAPRSRRRRERTCRENHICQERVRARTPRVGSPPIGKAAILPPYAESREELALARV